MLPHRDGWDVNLFSSLPVITQGIEVPLRGNVLWDFDSLNPDVAGFSNRNRGCFGPEGSWGRGVGSPN